jgi:uncharacterized CHY-type Zn-finger protein
MKKKNFASRGPSGTKVLICGTCNKTSSQVDERTEKLTCYKCVSRLSNPNSLFDDDVKPGEFNRLVLGKK